MVLGRLYRDGFSLLRSNRPQHRIVGETWGAIVNLPASPMQILMDLNRTWIDEHGRSFQVRRDVLTIG